MAIKEKKSDKNWITEYTNVKYHVVVTGFIPVLITESESSEEADGETVPLTFFRLLITLHESFDLNLCQL